VTREIWIGLEQNVIDAALNKWRKCLRAEPMCVLYWLSNMKVV